MASSSEIADQHDQTLDLGAFLFADGSQLENLRMRACIAGTGAKIVLVVHGITQPPEVGRAGGLWPTLAFPGQPWDKQTTRVICVNNLGSCFGSSGPEDAGWPLGVRLTPWDQARAIVRSLEALGIQHVDVLTGASLGGMIALCILLLRGKVRTFVPIATAHEASSWVVGLNHVARETIRGCPGPRGLALARQLAVMSYRCEAALENKQSRHRPPHDNYAEGANWAKAPKAKKVTYRVQSYLEHQGEKLTERFSANAYLAQLDAMDAHCVDPLPSDAALANLAGVKVLSVRITSDMLFTERAARLLEDFLRASGASVTRQVLKSSFGHDAFILEEAKMASIFRSCE
jgi:homoserine O-acetyltransferase/O-succinyltransferase